jgi:hypothetical protein
MHVQPKRRLNIFPVDWQGIKVRRSHEMTIYAGLFMILTRLYTLTGPTSGGHDQRGDSTALDA